MKVQGNYASIVRGVSQQAPADRLEGQHGEQINMIADPVRGLVRRNGMVIENQQLSVLSGSTSDPTSDSFSYRTYSYQTEGRDIDLIYRSRNIVGTPAGDHLDGLIVYEKTLSDDAGFKDLVLDGADDAIEDYLLGGFSAMQALGSYVVFAGNAITPGHAWESQIANQDWTRSGVIWIRGGGYSRTYTVKATNALTNIEYTASYTTMPAAFEGDLDLSGLDYEDPDYQKQVNDLTYAYEAAVNQHIADAAASIVPSSL